MEALIHAKAKLEIQYPMLTPLDAVQDEGMHVVLISLGAGGWTQLILAALKGVAGEMVGCQSDPDAVKAEQMTVLHIAVSQTMQYPYVVQSFLAARASI